VTIQFVTLLVAPPEPTFKDIGDAAVGIIGPSQWEPQVTYSAESAKAAGLPYFGPQQQDFTDAYLAKYNASPSYHAAAGARLGSAKSD
jgi:branched-chain amino acid transport system substrate-binding protein